MEKTIPVMQQCMQIAETVEKAAEHIQRLLLETEIEQTAYLLEDVVSAFATVQESMEPIRREIDVMPEIEQQAFELQRALGQLVDAYEEKDQPKAAEIAQFTFVPAVKAWRRAIDDTFEAYMEL
ncbi:hypothetical protein [Alkalicoccus chagannorensis]|uniref:hypothetical protein n=1 Tax=Alkalicoccus chagannorensis TaxID=427072 RepID=UPI00047E02A0|nr:hypothetical protein [Alkalicoccus chagannorensis]